MWQILVSKDQQNWEVFFEEETKEEIESELVYRLQNPKKSPWNYYKINNTKQDETP